MNSPTQLSNEQIEHFKTHGHVVLKNVFDLTTIDDWRQQIWHRLGTSLETPETWPESNQTWTMPRSGHIDGYGGEWLPLMLGATAYLYDVEPQGGAFTYWPDSHHAAHRYFLEHPSHLDGSFLDVDGFSWDVFCDNPATGGVEFTAEAGDLLDLWKYWAI